MEIKIGEPSLGLKLKSAYEKEVGGRGYSAYEIAVQEGFVGTEDEWLASLVGPQGAPGPQGIPGEQGIPGQTGPEGPRGYSAYEIAVQEGYQGTEEEWVNSFINAENYYNKTETNTLLGGKQDTIDSSHKLSSDLVDDTSSTNKFVSQEDITNWNNKIDSDDYASELIGGTIKVSEDKGTSISNGILVATPITYANYDNLDSDGFIAKETLNNVIAGKQLDVAGRFNTVAEMKVSTNLKNGMVVQTCGFYANNTGGGSYYIIRTKTNDDTADEMTLIALNDTNLIAELVIEKQMSVKQFGAYGDDTHDDTVAMQKCLNLCKNVIIDNGTYKVYPTAENFADNTNACLKVQSNSHITNINATIKIATNNLTKYGILFIRGADNVIIEGGIIQGDKTTHTGTEGQGGHCIWISSWSENVTIKNIVIKDAWGDGIYINRGRNIHTENVVCDNNRRQGVSVISVEGYHSLNDKFINTSGTSPESGIDIEPNSSTDRIKNIVLENLYTANNNGDGIDIWLPNLDNTSDPVSITILNHHDKGSGKGQRIGGHKENVRFYLLDDNPLLENNTDNGIDLCDWFDNEIDKLIINRPTIIDCNSRGSQGTSYVCGIAGYTTDEYTTKHIGGISIIEPFVTSKIETSIRGITFYDTTNTTRCENIDIINPRNHQSNLNIAIYGDNITFTDLYEQYTYSSNANKDMGASQLWKKVTNINFSSSRTITLGEGLPIGHEITIVVEKSSYRPRIQFSANDYCRYFNNNTGNLLSMDTNNALITLKKRAANEWFVTQIMGTISVSS